MRENLVTTWPCVGPFSATTTTLTPITEKELKRKTKQQQQQKTKNKKKKKERRRSSLRKKKHEKFKAGMRNWQMLAASKVKMSGSEKKKMERRNLYDFSSMKRATRKFHLRWSRAKQWERNVQKMCCTCKVFFSLSSPIDIFFISRCRHRLALQDF